VSLAPAAPVKTAEGASADIVFKIVEGPQTIVEHIFITGNLKTKPSVIERELEIKEGQRSVRRRSPRAVAASPRSGCSAASRSPRCRTAIRRCATS
jgi:hypothetical protein